MVASDTLDKLMPTFGNYGGILWRGWASELMASDRLDKLMAIYGNLWQLLAVLEGYHGEARQVRWWRQTNLTNLWKFMATYGNIGGILWRGEVIELVVSDRLDRPKGVSWQHELILSMSTGQFNGSLSIYPSSL